MNKKAIMVKFLTALLLAILIFAPACVITSKFFILSDQAKDNFEEFYQEIVDFSKSTENSKSFLLIMDEDSYVAKFDADQSIISNSIYGSKLYYPYPAQCNHQDCLVLCRKAKYDLFIKFEDKYQINCDNLFVKILDYNINVNSFFLSRRVHDLDSLHHPDTQTTFDRRVNILLDKNGNLIYVKHNETLPLDNFAEI